MKPLKTAEEFLEAHIYIERSVLKEQLIEAMKSYAAQAIERCAAEAKFKIIVGEGFKDEKIFIDRDSILNVKKLLK